MTDQSRTRFPQFYITAPQPCPYLLGRYEKKVFTHLLGDEPVSLNNALTQAGFRRSQNIAYRPACDDCQACVSVRVVVKDFQPGRTFRRILARNADLRSTPQPARATDEQYTLLRRYLDARHAEGGMADMSRLDYVAMVEDTTIATRLFEYRRPDGTLTAAALTDMLDDGLSMVYSFYEPGEPGRSLGTWMVLEHIERARALSLPYVYLGYWVDGSRKMAYKTRFRPLEALTMEGWRAHPAS
ncbi:Arginyltransferase [Parvibaculum lavamentivorans DS-1]|uniref:Aspartate/glutamate leucyltransferase n=1 Tax=Parvibaculum lavamentivorans (strain DS-1 / DSM 13023 / NCIMB 13966) TaxID=402881 RepID=BPT_PARL1|nr:arginyltransferase [Parvibaculum lavamentivorans]A7HX57.1 RecName: Full=Aspartate/glutamate leucyltransferase [Parvibaculum lavamentivorans DS-1]ABS64490.1 Arginyltransferase [Parvibaculum lavamentivorans DS-1]